MTAKLTGRLEILIQEDAKKQFFKTAKKNKAIPSKVLRKLIQNYINGQQRQRPPKNA